MLDSLYIKNFRNLKELKINSLGKVNLITGKNNTGKSSILEAIAIYATKGSLQLIYHLLEERGEYYRPTEGNKNTIESNIQALSSLFTNRLVGFEDKDAIYIGSLDNTLFGESQSSEKSVSLRFVNYLDESQSDNKVVTQRRTSPFSKNLRSVGISDYTVGLEIGLSSGSFIYPLKKDEPHRSFEFRGLEIIESFQLIRTRNIDREINGKLFDNIALTEKEQNVIEALKIIEPLAERIAFVEVTPRERTAVLKLSNKQVVLPLRSMGDGINRILTIILALINSDGSFLLIDEFENGLHHTVQTQLWKVIFHLADKLNVQVFVTTHSEDCINGFESILNSPDNSLDGKLIRLDYENGVIKQVEFNADELRIANDHNIEIR